MHNLEVLFCKISARSNYLCGQRWGVRKQSVISESGKQPVATGTPFSEENPTAGGGKNTKSNKRLYHKMFPPGSKGAAVGWKILGELG